MPLGLWHTQPKHCRHVLEVVGKLAAELPGSQEVEEAEADFSKAEGAKEECRLLGACAGQDLRLAIDVKRGATCMVTCLHATQGLKSHAKRCRHPFSSLPC